jgi:hypothetical protein
MIDQVAQPGTERRAYDPLDVQLDRVRAVARIDPGPTGVRVERRMWSAGAQILVLPFAGIALGGHGLGILNEQILTVVDPVVPVALAALGVLAAFEAASTLWMRSGIRSRLLGAITVQAWIAAAVVAAGTLAFVQLTGDAGYETPLLFVLALAVCAAPSSALATGDPAQRSGLARLIDLDALPAIVAGGLVIVAMREQDPRTAVSLFLQFAGLALTVAVAGWLLLAGASSETEQRMFGVAALLLLGGVADYLSLYALLAGLVAGAFWYATGGAAREALERDLAYLQHPLIALILLVAGARSELSFATIALAVVYVLLRAVGKLAGSLATTYVNPVRLPDLATRLLPPGILGVAFALGTLRAGGSDMSAVLAVAVLGTMGSQLLAGTKEPEDLP